MLAHFVACKTRNVLAACVRAYADDISVSETAPTGIHSASKSEENRSDRTGGANSRPHRRHLRADNAVDDTQRLVVTEI